MGVGMGVTPLMQVAGEGRLRRGYVRKDNRSRGRAMGHRNYMKCEVPTVVSVTAPLTLLPCPNAMQDIHRPRNTRPQNKREN